MRILVALWALLVASHATAVEIEKVPLKGGVDAWLVESHSLPMVHVQVSFKAGSVFDPADAHGLASLTAQMITEGSGEDNAQAFAQKLEAVGALMTSNANKLSVTTAMRMLAEHKDQSFKLFRQALTQPRFDEVAFKRVQDAVLTGIRAGLQNPSQVASKLRDQYVYDGTAYAHSTDGTVATVAALQKADVQNFYNKHYNQQNMVISVVGAITADELQDQLNPLIESLATGQNFDFPAAQTNSTPLVLRQEMAVPQSTVYMAHSGITRDDPDYYAAYVMNYILGGGGFNSRLMEEIREKRGLAYGVYSYFEPLPKGGAFVVTVSTKNEDVHKSIDLIKQQMSAIQKGVSEKEYQGAQAYLKGSFPLRLDSSSKVLGYLNMMQLHNMGVDYLNNWTKRIGQVTQADVARVAKRLLKPESMVTVIVGQNHE